VRRIGDTPGAMVTLSRSLTDGKQDWRTVLRQWLRSVHARNYSWNHFDRRFMHTGLYLPDLHTKAMQSLGIGSDTSASVMTERQIRIITDELNAALMEVRPKQTTIVYCDTEIQAVDEYTEHEYPIELYLKGHGGTRVSPIFDYFRDNDIRPVGLIIFTDLEIGDFPTEEPPYPVLWASTGNKTAPWGDVLMIDEV
jgi:predicted metal-dependent peptidase